MDEQQQDQIGRYKILSTLGEGAMARVYLAELATLGGFRRKVALKIVHPEFARDKKFIQLMGREAMIGSRLQHPNIVETLEFNEDDGRAYLALEYVEGQTLEQLLERIRNEGRDGLPLDFCVELILPVLEGLAYAHVLPGASGEPMGIIHRDLKPANIMVSRHGVVKLMDFGIAKARGTSSNLTTVGQVRGTPLYMSPEQVTGQELDGRSDQFSAATVFYELLTGARAFGGNNLIDIMQKVARGDPGNGVERLKEVHPRLSEIVGRMWSIEPEDRYPDCAEAAAAFEELLLEIRQAASVSEPTPAAPPDSGKPASRPRKKKRASKKGGGGILALMGLIRGPTKKSRKKGNSAQKRRKRKKRKLGTDSESTTSAPGPIRTEGNRRPEAPSASTAEEKSPDIGTVPPQPFAAADAEAEGRTISLIFMDEIFDDEALAEAQKGDEISATLTLPTPESASPNRNVEDVTTQKGTPVVTEPHEILNSSIQSLENLNDDPNEPQDESAPKDTEVMDDFFLGNFDDDS